MSVQFTMEREAPIDLSGLLCPVFAPECESVFSNVFLPGASLKNTFQLEPTEREMLSRLRLFSALGLNCSSRVLEVGAGGDYFTLAAVTSFGADYTNIDMEHQETVLDMVVSDLRRRKQQVPALGTFQNVYSEEGFEREPLEESSADFLVMLGVLDYVQAVNEEAIPAIVAQSLHVLKPGGIFIVATKVPADHSEIESMVERFAAQEDATLRKIGAGCFSAYSPQGSVYRLEEK